MEPEVQAQRPVLLNRCHFDRQTLLKSYKQLTRTFTLIQVGIALLILGLAIYYTVIYFPLFTRNPSLPVMVALIYLLGGVELWRALRAAELSVNRTLRRTRERFGVEEYDVTLRFEERELVSESSLSVEPGRLAYADFVKLKRYPELITIRTAARTLCTLDPNCFENGTEADFWRLMNQKCPSAVPKDRRA